MSDHEKIKQGLDDFVFRDNPLTHLNKTHLIHKSRKGKRVDLAFRSALSFAFFAIVFVALGGYAFSLIKEGANQGTGHDVNQLVQPRGNISTRFPKVKNEHFIQLIAILNRFDLKIEDVSEPYTQRFDGENHEAITITTNLGDLIVTDLGRDERVQIIDSIKYSFTNYKTLLIGTENKELHGMMEAMADLSQVKSLETSISPTFLLPYKTKDGKTSDYILRGIKGKVAFSEGPDKMDGVKKDSSLIADKVNKYMWYFWGDAEKYTTPDFKVVAVEQKTGKIKPVLVDGEGTAHPTKVWSLSIPHYSPSTLEKNLYELPTSMKISKPGKWDLNVFIAGIYEGTIVVDVK